MYPVAELNRRVATPLAGVLLLYSLNKPEVGRSIGGDFLTYTPRFRSQRLVGETRV